MIYLYTGTPGSGKSLNVARDIYNRLNRNKKYPSVIANFTINKKMIKNKKARFLYKDNSDLTVEFLLDFAIKNHTLGIENQTLVVVDECQVIWNAREWQSNTNRMDWIKFFTQHRKLGYNFIVIAQNDRMIDKQIRSLFEYEIMHRKLNNFKIGRILPMSTFIAVSRWYGVNEKLGVEFFSYRKKWGNFYDSYGTFELDSSLMNLINDNKIDEDLSVESSVEEITTSKKYNIKSLFNKDRYLYYFLLIVILFSSYMLITV